MSEVRFFPSCNIFEAGIGPVFSISEGIDIVPMLGFSLDLSNGNTEYIQPQLFLYANNSILSIELWNIFNVGTSRPTDGEFIYYGRYIVRLALCEGVAIGPYAELLINLSNDALMRWFSFPIGGILSLKYGQNNKLEFSFAVDTEKNNRFSPRVTFIHSF